MKKLFTLLLGVSACLAGSAADIITAPPAGATETLYCRNSTGIRYGMFSQLENFEYYGMAQYIYEEGRDVYMMNPVCPFLYDTYIKGTKTSTGLEFSLPQPIYTVTTESGKTETFYVDMFYLDPFTGEYFRDTEEGRTYDLQLQGNGNYKFDYLGVHSESSWLGTLYYTDRLLGIVEGSTGEWMGFGELTCRLLPFDSTTPTPPADLEAKTYQFIYDGNGHNVRVGTTDSEIYIQGMLEFDPEIWVKGSFDGQYAVFNCGDYIGIGEGQTIFMCGVSSQVNPETGATEPAPSELEFKYDAEKDVFTPTSKIWYCNSPELDETYAEFERVEIRPEPAVLNPTPETPYIVDWTNWDSTMEWAYTHVIISALNVNGDVLPTDRLSYAFFIDDELYFLDPADYRMLDEEMSWIPYNFTDNFDILAYARGRRTFYFFAEVDKTFAVQTRYLDDNGDYHYSQKYIVTTPGNEHLSVGDVKAADAVSEEYFDVTGRRVSKDNKGLTLRRMKMTDGSVKTIKVNNIR